MNGRGRSQKDCRLPPPELRPAYHGRQRQPAECKRHEAVQDACLEEMVRPDVPRLRRQNQGDGYPSNLGRRPRAHPGLPGQPFNALACGQEHHNKHAQQPGRHPQQPCHQAQHQQRTAMRIERVKCPHEWIGGKDRRIELVQQQGQAIGLISVETVVTA